VKVVVYCDLLATVLPRQVERTSTVEVVGEVNAGGGRGTCSRSAVVDVDFAVLSFITIGAHTLVSLSFVHTSCSILTGSFCTGVVLVLTSNTSVVSGAGAV